MKKKKKRYFFNCIEEAILNPDFKGLRYFRVEVFDRKFPSPYPFYEASFLVPEDLFEKLYEIFDFYETDFPIRINFDILGEKVNYRV